jgi:hypothetical protein
MKQLIDVNIMWYDQELLFQVTEPVSVKLSSSLLSHIRFVLTGIDSVRMPEQAFLVVATHRLGIMALMLSLILCKSEKKIKLSL